MSVFFQINKPYENLLLYHPESRKQICYDAKWQGARQPQQGKEADIKANRLPDLALPEDEIGLSRTAANTVGTASPANEHLSLIESHLLAFSFTRSKKRCQPSSLPNSPRDAGLLAGKEDMKRGEFLYPWVKEILNSQANIFFSTIQHYLCI